MYSVEFTSASANFSGAAGGFLFPGIFSSQYATDDRFRLDKLSARYGVEHRNGSTALRYSAMLSYGTLDARLYVTQARWMQPLRVLVDERWDNAGLWVLSPAVGVGYRHGDWTLDTGISLYFAMLTSQAKERKPAPPSQGDGGHNRVQPGCRWELVLRKAL